MSLCTPTSRAVAALYVDRRGPYYQIPGVDCWDVDRNADHYSGDLPVVAHPPCGPWGSLAHWYKGGEGDKSCAPRAVEFVRKFGGVLEHPRGSRLWKYMGLPLPGGQLDFYGGYTVEVRQVHWGHACVKPTWLYLVGGSWCPEHFDPARKPTHKIFGSRRGDTLSRRRYMERTAHLKHATPKIRRMTPPLFALDLIRYARSCASEVQTDRGSMPT